MLHKDDDFLTAITAQPGDRTLRLVYADWLDERADPRAELVRVEEEMRELPVFADRFWELKPRRNDLRALAGAEWCSRMRYGTECEPVFCHGIPDGWRERWRLIREFTERWYRVPMGDVGGRETMFVEAEKRAGRALPPSMREWIAFMHDTPRDKEGYYRILGNSFNPESLDGVAAFSLQGDYDFCGKWHDAVLYNHFNESDPPMQRCWDRHFGDNYDVSDVRGMPTSLYFFWYIYDEGNLPTGGESQKSNIDNIHQIEHELRAACFTPVKIAWVTLYEAHNLFVQVSGRDIRVRCSRAITRDQIPVFLWDLLDPRDGSGIFTSKASPS